MGLKSMVSTVLLLFVALAVKLKHHNAKACGVRLFSQLLPWVGVSLFVQRTAEVNDRLSMQSSDSPLL
jgi:hypothetical protein